MSLRPFLNAHWWHPTSTFIFCRWRLVVDCTGFSNYIPHTAFLITLVVGRRVNQNVAASSNHNYLMSSVQEVLSFLANFRFFIILDLKLCISNLRILILHWAHLIKPYLYRQPTDQFPLLVLMNCSYVVRRYCSNTTYNLLQKPLKRAIA